MSKFCPRCERYSEIRVSEREETYEVRHSEVTVPVEVEMCERCGYEFDRDATDRAASDAAHREYRQMNGLLTPEEIKHIRELYNLSQRSFAALLGMSEATVNRYENGALQDEAHDALMRACENPSFMRDRLLKNGNRLSDWQRNRVGKAIDNMISSSGKKLSCDGSDEAKRRIMSFAGSWDSISEKDFNSLLNDVRRRRGNAFTSRNRP